MLLNYCIEKYIHIVNDVICETFCAYNCNNHVVTAPEKELVIDVKENLSNCECNRL